MGFKLTRLMKRYRQLKMLFGLARKAVKAAGWLFGAYKKRAKDNKNSGADSDYNEYVTRKPRGWQDKAAAQARAWAHQAGHHKGWQEPESTGTGRWQPPGSAQPYLAAIGQAEQQHGIPAGVLARLLYQECRYREDIICGKVVSSAGAVGIAQIVPRWHPEARPLDPEHSIFYAARYLAQLNRQFGHWPTALAAYNWGPGNVSKARKQHGDRWLERAPKETRDYVRQIAGDCGLL